MTDKTKAVTGVTGRNKEPKADDPMELLVTTVAGGDPQVMATCIIEEFAHLGMGEAELLGLFQNPAYQTHALYRERGEAWVRDLIRDVLRRTGRIQVSVTEFHHIGEDNA